MHVEAYAVDAGTVETVHRYDIMRETIAERICLGYYVEYGGLGFFYGFEPTLILIRFLDVVEMRRDLAMRCIIELQERGDLTDNEAGFVLSVVQSFSR
ncbi:MAG: hypothetical protein JWO15_3526 [Sphingomonadales bacterium]|nr:hypothetical protein [Sphingomonadales bacterium]